MQNIKEIHLLASIISSCKTLEDIGYGKTGPRKIIRETIHFIWETGLNKPAKFSKKRIRSHMASKERNNQNLRYDHPVPLKIIIEKLFALDEIDEKNVKKLLSKYIKNGGVLITKDEDKTLTEIGLKSSMPDNWDGVDVYARYKSANIDLLIN